MAFGWIDWTVLAVYLLGTSWLADRLAGSRQTIRDFFLGGRRLPWWAVSGSIVASEISGVTFVTFPAIAWARGGDYSYLMIASGSVLARLLIAWLFVPAFYRKEIYSPYEFMGQALGPAVDRVTTGLFIGGALLAQGARLFLAALMLDVITDGRLGLGGSIAAVAAVSVVWTWVGGINSVVWTDLVQFVILFAGALTALVAAVWVVPGGWGEVVQLGRAAGKFRMWDFSTSPTAEFTFWCGLFGSTFLTLGSHGTDQNMAQRIFCCRSVGDARKAVAWSSVSQLLPALMLTVGVGIYAYFTHAPMSPRHAALVAERKDYLLPVFILEAMPAGLKGLLFAAVFSAATATGTLAALAQTAMTGLYLPLRRGPRPEERRLVFVSRVFVALAAVGLGGTAWLCARIGQYGDLVRLALSMAAYTYGALLGTFFLALAPRGRDARGLQWGVPLSILLVLALNWGRTEAGMWVVLAGCAAAAASAVRLRREPVRALVLLAGAYGVAAVAHAGLRLAFPWHFPLGTALTYGLGLALGRRALEKNPPAAIMQP
jgi:SSS family solute:Na+ symporter